MSRAEFVYVTYIATTAEKLWAALTLGEFTQRYSYRRRVESDWKVGSPVRFYDGDSDDVADYGEVLECDPPSRLVYSFVSSFDPSAGEEGFVPSRVAFDLEPQAEGMVKLTLVHDRLPADLVDDFRQGWAPILSSLKTFLETGEPLPQLAALEEKGNLRAESRES